MKRINQLQYLINKIKSYVLGCPHIVVTIVKDRSCNKWIGFNDHIGLAAQAESIDELVDICESLIPDLLESKQEKEVLFHRQSSQVLA